MRIFCRRQTEKKFYSSKDEFKKLKIFIEARFSRSFKFKSHLKPLKHVDDLLERFEDVVVGCLLLLHHLQELHLPEQYSLYVSWTIKVSFAVQETSTVKLT